MIEFLRKFKYVGRLTGVSSTCLLIEFICVLNMYSSTLRISDACIIHELFVTADNFFLWKCSKSRNYGFKKYDLQFRISMGLIM